MDVWPAINFIILAIKNNNKKLQAVSLDPKRRTM